MEKVVSSSNGINLFTIFAKKAKQLEATLFKKCLPTLQGDQISL
jgi:hypothetical protein